MLPRRASPRLSPMSRAKVWGKRMRERRELLNMSQTDLAGEVGVDQSTVSKWERGEVAPSHHHIPRIAKALHYPDPSVLFDYEETA